MGQQDQLSELIHQLINTGWLKELDTKKHASSSYAKAVLQAFDISLTKKRDTSNPEPSFVKVFRGELNEKTGDHYPPSHPEYTKRKNYTPRFSEIKPI